MPEHHHTFKRHRIALTRDGYDKDWYIQVTAPDGGYVYDGWWRDSADKTAAQALEEAKRGALLAPCCVGIPDGGQR